MRPRPVPRVLVWLAYTFVLAEVVPFLIVLWFSNAPGAPKGVITSFLGFTTMPLALQRSDSFAGRQ